MRALAALLACGCTLDGVPVSGPSCTDVAAEVKDWIDSHASCMSDGDCAAVTTACGLADGCGGYVNKSAVGPHLDGLLAEWRDGQCGPACPCPPPPSCRAIGCFFGTCKCSPTGPAAVGDGCASNTDCMGGLCITDGGFAGGYCSAPCGGDLFPCADGSTCLTVGNAMPRCYASCANGCRPGYACCNDCAGHSWCGPDDASCHQPCGG